MGHEDRLFSITQEGFNADKVVSDGNKFLLGNGYMGYRGTLDGYTKKQCVAMNIASLYDGLPDRTRETVNAPDPFYLRVYADGVLLDPTELAPSGYVTKLDIYHAEYSRCTAFEVNGKKFEIRSSRALCGDEYRGAVSTLSVTCSEDCSVDIEYGINPDIWDMNGTHLVGVSFRDVPGGVVYSASTQENGVPVSVALLVNGIDAGAFTDGIMRVRVDLKAGKAYTIERFAAVCYGDEAAQAEAVARGLMDKTMAGVLAGHYAYWEKLWKLYDVEMEGSDRAQLALRYSIYQLMILAPRRFGSIAARGLSAQTYKGAVFWDTEVFMLPVFLANDYDTSKRLVEYRIKTLDAAKRKAAHYGYQGAFYAWESQDGEDACSDYNLIDLFTHRKVKTFFKDKQIHISADVVYAIDGYIRRTGDTGILYEGGLKTMLECSLFYYSRGYYNYIKDRYELLDVIGPDEYHERVSNNAYTNYMVHYTIKSALGYYKQVYEKDPEYAVSCADSVSGGLIEKLTDFADRLYLPRPDENGVIEQCDGYMLEEDVTVEQVRARLVDPKEYWGGSTGVATATRVLKQADVIALMVLLPDCFTPEIVAANYDFYLRYTEHGSSLSACMYAMAACYVGRPDDAWQWFLKTAEIDLNASAKLWLGDLYIGGTHPAANGGAYLTAICGFAGVNMRGGEITVNPHLPKDISSMKFCLTDKGKVYRYTVTREGVEKEEL